jgi:hypothetical protein
MNRKNPSGNSKTPLAMMAISLLLPLAGTTTAVAQKASTETLVSPHAPVASHYAETLYDEYAAGAGGGISFVVQTLESGPMKDLAGRPFSTFITAPEYRILTDQRGTNLENARFYMPGENSYGQHDMGYTADKFADYGLPLEDGVYRRLLVTASVGGDTRSHQALEFCWPALNHCAVLDPAVLFLQSKVDTRLNLASTGWGPRLTSGGLARSSAAIRFGPEATCGLSSHHGWDGETLTWAAWTQTYKDVFGITLVTKHLGEQIDGISCDSSCKPQPYSTSNASSASGTLGWKTACSNKGDAGKSGSTARSIAETKCTDAWEEKASASVTVEGGGASFSFDWSLGGSVDSNGGVYTESCGYF